ncbi:MAG: hypothetical protein K0B15_15250 [Lentimicrobium sp.]|nr:hypothetical protein [Lentimicrobium sp.]
MNRLKYFGYYLIKTDWKRFLLFLIYASQKTSRSKTAILFDAIQSTFRYNISLLDYFYFRFYEKDQAERKKWAGTGFMYEYHLEMNPKASRQLLINKIEFLKHFRQFVTRQFASIHELKANNALANRLLENASGRLVLKGSHGQVGAEVEVVECNKFTVESLLQKMQHGNYDLVEEYVVQHPALMALSPSGLNTVRIFTQLHNGKVDFLGARLRVSVNSPVDNMAAGNLAAPLDLETGTVTGPGVYSDIAKKDESFHPVTGYAIEGFKVPFWEETLKMVTDAALLSTANRSVGWDVAITSQGPELIEGNHNWCKLLWQLPVKKGLKEMLLKYYP